MNTSEECRSRFGGYSTETSVLLATVIRYPSGNRQAEAKQMSRNAENKAPD